MVLRKWESRSPPTLHQAPVHEFEPGLIFWQKAQRMGQKAWGTEQGERRREIEVLSDEIASPEIFAVQ